MITILQGWSWALRPDQATASAAAAQHSTHSLPNHRIYLFLVVMKKDLCSTNSTSSDLIQNPNNFLLFSFISDSKKWRKKMGLNTIKLMSPHWKYLGFNVICKTLSQQLLASSWTIS